MNTLGNTLRDKRLELGLTLEEVGDYVGVGKSIVSRWERGAIKNIRNDKVKKISEILHISQEAIFNYAIIDTLAGISEQMHTENEERKARILKKLNDEPEYIDIVEAVLRIKNTEIEWALQIVSVLAK